MKWKTLCENELEEVNGGIGPAFVVPLILLGGVIAFPLLRMFFLINRNKQSITPWVKL